MENWRLRCRSVAYELVCTPAPGLSLLHAARFHSLVDFATDLLTHTSEAQVLQASPNGPNT